MNQGVIKKKIVIDKLFLNSSYKVQMYQFFFDNKE